MVTIPPTPTATPVKKDVPPGESVPAVAAATTAPTIVAPPRSAKRRTFKAKTEGAEPTEPAANEVTEPAANEVTGSADAAPAAGVASPIPPNEDGGNDHDDDGDMDPEMIAARARRAEREARRRDRQAGATEAAPGDDVTTLTVPTSAADQAQEAEAMDSAFAAATAAVDDDGDEGGKSGATTLGGGGGARKSKRRTFKPTTATE